MPHKHHRPKYKALAALNRYRAVAACAADAGCPLKRPLEPLTSATCSCQRGPVSASYPGLCCGLSVVRPTAGAPSPEPQARGSPRAGLGCALQSCPLGSYRLSSLYHWKSAEGTAEASHSRMPFCPTGTPVLFASEMYGGSAGKTGVWLRCLAALGLPPPALALQAPFYFLAL